MYNRIHRPVAVALALLGVLTLLCVPAPSEAARPAPPLLPGLPAPRLSGTLVARTYSLDFYQLPGGMDADAVRHMALNVEHTVVSDTVEIGKGLAGRISISLEPPQTGPCAIRGLTLSNKRTIRLFYAPDADPARVTAILSHEIFHQLQRDYYGERDHRKADTLLLEGMATWGSRAQFLDANGQPTYRNEVQAALRENRLLPLATDLDADCRTGTRVSIYSQWASFVEYLLAVNGRAKFDAVYRSSRGRAVGTAGYRAVYGKTLVQLEEDWKAWLVTQR